VEALYGKHLCLVIVGGFDYMKSVSHVTRFLCLSPWHCKCMQGLADVDWFPVRTMQCLLTLFTSAETNSGFVI